MPSFSFRIRVNLRAYRIGCDDEVAEIGRLPGGQFLRLRAARPARAIKDSDRFAILGGPFATAGAADEAAREVRRRLLHWALKYRVGLDLGGGQPRGAFTKAGL